MALGPVTVLEGPNQRSDLNLVKQAERCKMHKVKGLDLEATMQQNSVELTCNFPKQVVLLLLVDLQSYFKIRALKIKYNQQIQLKRLITI